ncbi:MAG: cytochrome C biogenesis protein [Chloroflexi bacterium]|nr:cytochrome C biogenesis protein [Chloroflexota bacterium]
MKTSFFAVVMSIIRKDFQAEWRSRELVGSMGLFALLSVLVFSFALELDRVARSESISGVLWVTIVFASILGLNRSMAMERDQGNLDALLLAPIQRSAIFVGKLVGNYVFTLLIGLLLLPLMTFLYNVNLISLWLIVMLVLGTLGFTTLGTLLAAMTVQTRSREALLPIVMMPVVLPLLLASVRASTAILNSTPQSDWIQWVQIVLVLDVIYGTMCFLLFEFVVEE